MKNDVFDRLGPFPEVRKVFVCTLHVMFRRAPSNIRIKLFLVCVKSSVCVTVLRGEGSVRNTERVHLNHSLSVSVDRFRGAVHQSRGGFETGLSWMC